MERLQAMATGLEIGKSAILNNIQYAGYLIGKDHHQASRVPRTHAAQKLAIVFVDICGPMDIKSLLSDVAYFCIFVDSKTHFTWVYCLRMKDKIHAA